MGLMQSGHCSAPMTMLPPGFWVVFALVVLEVALLFFLSSLPQAAASIANTPCRISRVLALRNRRTFARDLLVSFCVGSGPAYVSGLLEPYGKEDGGEREDDH